MHKALGRPPIFFVDIRPVNRPLVIVSRHEIAEQISKASRAFPTSIPKTDMSYFLSLTGPTSILHAPDGKWKALRKRYSPAFAPKHLMTHLPCILEKTLIFVKHLDALAQTGEEFSFATLATNLTFDIIGAVVIDVDLEAQSLDPKHQGELVRLYSELFRTYWGDDFDIPWWLTPHVELKRHRLSKRIDVLMKDMIRRKYAEQQAHGGAKANKPRSILYLSLQDAENLSPELLDETCDQVKTFLLGGHDTVSSSISWVFYWLSRTPRALAAARSELDSLLGTEADPEAVCARLLSPGGPDTVHRMLYISAVIKETLRLQPPSATARYVEHGTGFTVRTPEGEDYCLDGTIIYNCESIIQRDPAVYGDSTDCFMPERWLSSAADGSNSNSNSNIPASAWRPFERGPRNCIGQEFAMIELRVIVAAIARRFDFTKVGLGELVLDENNQPVLGEDGSYGVKSQLYSVSNGQFYMV